MKAATLSLSQQELGFLKQLSPYVGNSPRRALRFLNVYRVIKASLSEEDLALLERGAYRALMAAVAAVTGAPRALKRWTSDLQSTADGATIEAVVSNLAKAMWLSAAPDSGSLVGALTALAGSTDPSEGAQLVTWLRRFAPLARRYSFTG
jgi:hypothetical protein